MAPLPKVVFLDWMGTLSTSRFLQHWDAEGHAHRADFARFQTWWFAPETQPFMVAWLRGVENAESFVTRVAGLLDLSPDFVMRELVESFDGWTLLEPATKSLVAALRDRGVKVVLATENVDAWQRWALPALGLSESFDAVLSSHTLGYAKGDVDERGRSRFFVPFLKSEEIAPGESVLIDDADFLAPVMAATGIDFRPVPYGVGPGSILRKILGTDVL